MARARTNLVPAGRRRGNSATPARFRPGRIPAAVRAQGQAAVYRYDGMTTALGAAKGGKTGGAKS